MRNSHGNDLLRAQVNSSMLYRVFNIAFIVLFAIIILLAIFGNPGVLYSYSTVMLVIAAAAGAFVIFLVSRLFSAIPMPKAIVERIIVIILLVLLLGAQIYIGRSLLFEFDPASDTGRVFLAARDYVLGNPSPGEVFQLWPRGAGLYSFWCGFFSILHLFGVTQFYFPAMVLNAVAITAAVFLLFLCVRRMFGSGKSLFVLVASFFTMPLVAGAALPCAETLVLPILIAAVMIWLRARSFWRGGEVKKAVIRTCIASAILGAGALLKMTVLVVWVALAIDLLVLLCGKGRLRLLLASFLSMAVVYMAVSFALWMSPLLPAFRFSERMPETAFVMASMAEEGAVAADYERLETFDDAGQRAAIAEVEISGRLGEMGAGGFVVHLMDRLAYLFGDGSYSLAGAYNQSDMSTLWTFFAANGAQYYLVAYITFAFAAGLLIWMLVGALKSIYRGNDAFTFLRVAIFGLTLFMLFWDAGPRWLVSLLPLMILGALEAAPVPQVARTRARPPSGEGRREDNTAEIPLPPMAREEAPDGRPDYMNPTFGLVREEGAPARPADANVQNRREPQMYHAQEAPVQNPSSQESPPDAPASSAPMPTMPPQLTGTTLWEFMEEDE